MPLDIERRLAIADLLMQPDPPELRRGHRLRLEGKPGRYGLVPQLSAVFVQAQLLALEERRAEAEGATANPAVVEEPRRVLRKVIPIAA